MPGAANADGPGQGRWHGKAASGVINHPHHAPELADRRSGGGPLVASRPCSKAAENRQQVAKLAHRIPREVARLTAVDREVAPSFM